MITKKDKFIESAQKFIVKGQLDKALKDFEQAVALDPGDIKVRQRLAELLVRVNRQEEAIPEYETIAKYFADRSFFLKAIAVYKQVQKLDPNSIKTTLTLAELNVKQGLVGNALAEFSHLVNQHLKTGKYPEALNILDRMTEIDPDNLNTALKIAETNQAAGKHAEAYEQYCRLACQLLEHPDKSPFHRLCERINNLFPEKECSPLGFITYQMEHGEAEKAYSNLRDFLSRDPDNIKAWHLICDAIRALGEMGQLRSALTRMHERFPDEIRPREELIDLTILDGESDEALKLLQEQREFLLSKGREEQLEQFYARLQANGNILPPDTHSEPLEPESFKGLIDESMHEDEQTETAVQDALTLQQGAEWEEDVDLGLEEEQEEPQPALTATIETEAQSVVDAVAVMLDEPEIITPEITITHEEEPTDSSELSAESAIAAPSTTDSEDDGWQEENEEPSRMTLTILSPLPIQAFLPPPPFEAKEESSKISLSALDELSEQLELEIASLPEPPSILKKRKPHDPAAVQSESSDWSITDNPITTAAAIGLQTEEISPKFIVETHKGSSPELDFEMEDLTDFTEALFGEESQLIGTIQRDESDIYSLGNLLSAFKKGVDEQIDESDTESHYSLGIAYKEMGLYEEAVREFRSAARDPRRSADCASLEGICLRDKGDLLSAEEVFRAALELPALSGEALLNMKYELAFLYELSERAQEAITIYHEIIGIKPNFRDVKHRLHHLCGDDADDILEPEMIELDEENNG